jgi:hypothetical protein
MGSSRPVVDQIRLLSIVAGAFAAALFRLVVAPRLAASRGGANHGTAWLVLGSAYSRLLVSDEPHMITMPWLVALAAAVLAFCARPTFRRAAAAGAFGGLAALGLASNVLVGVSAAVVLGWDRAARGTRADGMRAAGGVLLGLVAVAGSGWLAAWAAAGADRSWWEWLLAYAGGHAPERAGLVYGAAASSWGLVPAGMRALYGAAGVTVDLGPAVRLWRDEGAVLTALGVAFGWTLAAIVMAAAAFACWRRRHVDDSSRAALLLQAVWWPAVLGFGLFWNDSKHQFYVALSVPLAALAATLDASRRARPLVVACSLLALAGNAGDLLRRFVLYPRAENTAALMRGVSGACLVVVPGYDEADALLTLAEPNPPADRLALTDLAVAMPAGAGLAHLASAAARCWTAGRRVDLVDVVDAPPERAPWKFLRALGYERKAVLSALDEGTLDGSARLAGPFRVRSVRPRP